MTNIKTKSGFECQISEEVLNDMEVLDSIVAIDKGDMMAYSDFVGKILSTEGKRRLYDHCRLETGRVPIERVAEEVSEIMEGLQEGGKK